MVIKKLVLLALLAFVTTLSACSFKERDFRDLACVGDQDCSRPDQECRSNMCTQRSCSASVSCPSGYEFSCTGEGLCVASECTEATGCSTGFACNEGFCQASFNVVSVAAISNTSIAVTFDAPPDSTTATVLGNFVVNGLTLSGTPVLNGSTVMLTTSAQMSSSYTVTVANVLRDSDQAPLIVATGSFTGRGPFNVVSAASASAITVAITFSEPPDSTTALNVANYAITNNLSVLASPAPSLDGNVLTLYTGTQDGSAHTVTVSNVIRASDGEALTNTMASFTGRTDFNVAGAQSLSSTSISVTFDAPPNTAQASLLSSYSVPGLTLSGQPSLSGNTVTITTSPQSAINYVLTVTGVDRASDGEALTIPSDDFLGRAPFNVVDALARSTRQFSVEFDAAPDPAAATTLANYSVNGLVLTGTPVLAGNVVFIDTVGNQGSGTYTVTVSNVTRASDSEPLATNTAMFIGRLPFNVATASATSSTTVAVTFSDAPNSGQAVLAGNYTLGGLTVLNASAPTGNTVILTTTPMTNITYTLTVAGVTRAADGESLTMATAMFTGRAPYNVASATAPTSSTITVTFDAPPNMTAATTLSNYNVPGITLLGTPSLSGSTVTIQTAAQTAEMHTVTVTGVTRASDSEPLATNTASFMGRARFNVQSASSGSNVTMRIVFDATPNEAEAETLSNYSISGGLTLSGTPVLVGNTVTITTSTQTGAAQYTVTVTNVTRATDAEPLTTDTANFLGLAGFNVTGAVAANTTTVEVTFDAEPNASQAQTEANYTIAGVTVLLATLSGNTVTLTTSALTDGNHTVSVANVTRDTDASPLVVNSAAFSYTSFNVVGAASVTNRLASITFDAAPNAAQAVIQGNYSVSCTGGPCVTLSNPVLSGNTVTFTTTSQVQGRSYTITVNNVTRASDGSTLTVKTGAFVGRLAFNVTTASAPTSGTVVITFDGAPNLTQAQTLANYSIPGLTLSGSPVVSGNQVTINTTVQTATNYTATVSNVTRAADAEPLNTNAATFAGKAQTAPTVTNVVVQSTVPDNGTTFFNTGTATVLITGTEFNGVNCLTGVRLDDVDGSGAVVNTKPTTCTVDNATQITATFPAGIRSNYTGWDVQVTNSVGMNTTSTVKLVVKAGLLVSEVYVGSSGGGSAREFLEIFNPTQNTINLDNVGIRFHVRNAGGTDTLITFNGGGGNCAGGVCTKDIAAGKFWLMVSQQSGVSTADSWWAKRNAVYDTTVASAANQLTRDSTVYMSLSDTPQLRVIDKVGWGSVQNNVSAREGSATNDIADNQSIEREPGGTAATTDTDNNANDFLAPATSITPKGTRD